MHIRPTWCAALSVGWLTLAPSASHAYDLRTHTLLSERAFTTSVEVQRYLPNVGLSRTRVLDLGSATKPERLADFTNDGTPLGWLVEGSIREDDYNTNLAIVGCAKPRNPPSAIDRVRHHFYDPDTNGGLGVGPLTGLPAPEWALGELGRGPGATENQFSLRDARLYQLRSLIEATPEERERQAALMFRSLGQVIHILEDMAQPQHTRGDVHPACETLLESVIPEHSWYESYIEQRVRGGQFRGRSTTPFHLASYPAPSFATTRSFFTAVGQRGLAEFSSHNFFTTRTNLWSLPIPCGGRVEPPCRVDAYTPVDVSQASQNRPRPHRRGEGTALPPHDARPHHGRADPGRGRQQPLGLGSAPRAARRPAEVLSERLELRLPSAMSCCRARPAMPQACSITSSPVGSTPVSSLPVSPTRRSSSWWRPTRPTMPWTAPCSCTRKTRSPAYVRAS